MDRTTRALPTDQKVAGSNPADALKVQLKEPFGVVRSAAWDLVRIKPFPGIGEAGPGGDPWPSSSQKWPVIWRRANPEARRPEPQIPKS